MSHTINFEKINESEPVIRLSELKDAIAEKRKELDEKIIQEWMECITRECISEKIVEAEAQGHTYTILVEKHGEYDTLQNLRRLFTHYHIKDKIQSFLDPSFRVYMSSEFITFRIYISWDNGCMIF